MSPLCDTRKFLQYALVKEGKPYLWGAKGPNAFDCSGLVTWALWKCGGPDWRLSHNSQALYDSLAPELLAMPGAVLLSFYGRAEHINHVMVVTGDGRVFGACGGDSLTTTLEVAARKMARVRFRSSPTYRSDFRGYRRLELCQPKEGDSPHA